MAIRASVGNFIRGITESSRSTLLGSASTERGTRGAPCARYDDDHPALPARFRMRHKLGQGGMGVVYQVFDSELGHDVALKSLHRREADDLYYLKNEFRSLADLGHPNLVDLHELFVDERGCFFTMELVPGLDLVDYVKLEGSVFGCDYAKVRDAARQLALGVAALHAAGKLHRDIKPSNVRVTHAGRVVMLDFGLVAPLSDARATLATGTLVGTIEYMAPEQARGEALTPAADWYGFGATLFEAMTGRLPLEEPLPWLLGDSRARGPSRPSQSAADVPHDLDELVFSLLHRDQRRRPSQDDVLRILTGTATWTAPSASPQSFAPSRLPFEGRSDELDVLSQALERTRAGQTEVVHLRGPSGIGKTELVRRFIDRAAAAGSLVLRGRCHPQESVAFNALDGLVDDLSTALEPIAEEERISGIAADVDALIRLFPVLGRVLDDRGATVPRDELGHETFRRAARALKLVLRNVSSRGLLVVWLDDVQWGDEDSGKLLREILTPPDAPSLLLILSYRAEDRGSSRTLTILDGIPQENFETTELPLAPLSESQTLAVVERLLGGAWRGPPELLARLAGETGGLPFFAHELARYLGRMPDAPESREADVKLEDMLDRRMLDLSDDARRVLEIVSVAGGPFEQKLLLRAAAPHESGRTILAALERASLIRSATVDADRRAEIYHHKIREVVLASLGDETRRAHHGSIARAILTVASPELSRAVEHFEAAEDLDGVRRYVVAAAKQAATLLAFDRAAKLFQRAIDLGRTELPDSELHARLADALGAAGRGRDAARAFERAASSLEAMNGSTERAAFLRKRAAQQYLQSGQWDEAANALTGVLASLAITLPKGPVSALGRAALHRARVAIHGLEFERRPRHLITPKTIDRLEMLQTLMGVYSVLDVTIGAACASQLLADALVAGDPDMIMRGLAADAINWATMPGAFAQRQSQRLLDALKGLLPTDGDVYHHAGYEFSVGAKSWLLSDFAHCLERMDAAKPGLQEAGRDAPFYVAVCESFRLPALAHLGKVKILVRDVETLVADADARGDHYFLAMAAVGHPSLAWLALDRPEQAIYWCDRTRAILPRGFAIPHYLNFLARTLIDMYRGKGAQASERVEATWPELTKRFFLSLPYFGEDLRQLRARAAISAALELGPATARGRVLLATARRETLALKRKGTPLASGYGELLSASISNVEGRAHDTAAALKAALPSLDRAGLQLYSAAARLALAELMPGSEDDARAAIGFMRREGVVKPIAFAKMFAPGLVGASASAAAS